MWVGGAPVWDVGRRSSSVGCRWEELQCGM